MLFEQGPIRPPSEAASLLLRVTRNCPWNKCEFCITYKDTSFSRRDPEELRQEILAIKATAEQVDVLSRELGYGGEVNSIVIRAAQHKLGPYGARVAVWLSQGARTVFLQDANSLMVKPNDLVDILTLIRSNFPGVERVTTYARANTAARKSLKELKALRQAGLTRIHMGMESGSANVLAYVQKGVTPDILIAGGQKIVAAGISLCLYIMPGLGGVRWSEEHALATAQVLNAVNPDHIRLRTLALVPGTPLYDKARAGEFQVPGEDDLVREIKLLISSLAGINSQVVSDHILNLLEELRGQLPEDQGAMLSLIDRYLALPDAERANYCVGRRMGIYRSLTDLSDLARRNHVAGAVARLGGDGDLKKLLERLKQNFL